MLSNPNHHTKMNNDEKKRVKTAGEMLAWAEEKTDTTPKGKPRTEGSIVMRILRNADSLRRFSSLNWPLVRYWIKTPVEELVGGMKVRQRLELISGSKEYRVPAPVGNRKRALEMHGYKIAVVNDNCFLLKP